MSKGPKPRCRAYRATWSPIKASKKSDLSSWSAEFIGRLAQEFELIVQRGLLRNRAIASVIDWASAECLRSSPRQEMKNSE